MTLDHTPARIPSTLRKRACLHRRCALEALRADMPTSVLLSRYWSHIGQARAFEALERAQTQSMTLMQGGAR